MFVLMWMYLYFDICQLNFEIILRPCSVQLIFILKWNVYNSVKHHLFQGTTVLLQNKRMKISSSKCTLKSDEGA